MGAVRSGDSRLIQWWDLGDSDLCFSLSAASAADDVVSLEQGSRCGNGGGGAMIAVCGGGPAPCPSFWPVFSRSRSPRVTLPLENRQRRKSMISTPISARPVPPPPAPMLMLFCFGSLRRRYRAPAPSPRQPLQRLFIRTGTPSPHSHCYSFRPSPEVGSHFTLTIHSHLLHCHRR